MRRRTFTLSDDLSDALDREAMLRGASASEVLRALLEAALATEGRPNEIPWANIGTADGPPWAADVDDYLERNWAKDVGRREIPFAGSARSLEPIDASRLDEMLAESWADHHIQESMNEHAGS